MEKNAVDDDVNISPLSQAVPQTGLGYVQSLPVGAYWGNPKLLDL